MNPLVFEILLLMESYALALINHIEVKARNIDSVKNHFKSYVKSIHIKIPFLPHAVLA